MICEAASHAASAAGEYIQSQFNANPRIQHKEGGASTASQVVTEVDAGAQEIILSHLEEITTSHDFGLLTEEAVDDMSRTQKDYFWCIDPMDGTLPFVEGKTGYAVSIALVSQKGDPVIGVVVVPDQSLCYSSIKGAGVLVNNEPFVRGVNGASDILHVFMDRSFQKETYCEQVTSELDQWAKEQRLTGVRYNWALGAVRNALGVMTSEMGCYFKFPKEPQGGGSTWDYAATRLFFEELGMCVSDASGNRIHLNQAETTFMNTVGVLYATHSPLSTFIRSLGDQI